MKKICLVSIFAGLTIMANAVVKPSSLIGDNMVLQQKCDARLWGTADPGSKISVSTSWDGKTYTTQTDRTGEWCLAVHTPEASFTPYTITISDGEPLILNNVLVGEVWLASGQSNMEMPLKGFGGCNVKDGFEEVAFSRQWADKVRFFTVPLRQSYTPLDETPGFWAVPSPETAPDFSATAWYFATQLSEVLNLPVGIISCAHGGARVESWLPREILQNYPDVSLDEKDIEAMTHYLRPMMMYNAMFNPVKNYTVNGIIWYQGCSNVGADETYADRLATMVARWREDLGTGDRIPFYAVEIAPYDYDGSQDNRAPYLREAQWKAIGMIPNSGMIGTNDLVTEYERFNIHPADKKTVGHRLSNLALNRTYGKTQFPVRHPRYKGHTVKGNEVWVAIDSPDMGICRNYDIRGFEVAGPDKIFHPADSAWLHWQTNEVVVSSEKVPNPVAVRYGFGDFLPGTLYGGNWLPLIPFRSDNW